MIRKKGFNPYRVFKFVATPCRGACIGILFQVSIPIGFSSSLQPWTAACIRQIPGCFNPYRVFKFVATLEHMKEELAKLRFQSLSGFQVRCNVCGAGRSARAGNVSIPIGFSSSLQQFREYRPEDLITVSIPIGFSSSLQRPPQSELMTEKEVSIPIGFSSSLQRLWCSFLRSSALKFQSLSGFQVRCNSF